jgi:hypothetical protein
MKVKWERPYLYPKQLEFVDSKERYTIVEASTKSGKTVSMIVLIFEEALKLKKGQYVWWVAPVASQARIAYERTQNFLNDPSFISCHDTHMTIRLRTGGAIQFKSADNAQTLYGEDVHFAVFDEYTRAKEDAWFALRSTLTATGGRVVLIGNVRGKKNWGYKLARAAEEGRKNWKHVRISAQEAVEAGVFSQEELEDAKEVLPGEIYRELYEAKAVDSRGKPFIYTFDAEKHIVDNYQPDWRLPVYVSFDFNVDPLTCIFSQHDPDWQWIRTFNEIAIDTGDLFEMCERIRVYLPKNAWIIVNGDASGKNRSINVRSNLNNYEIIQKELLLPDNSFEIPTKNPNVANSRMLTLSLFAKHPDIGITRNCERTIDDLKYVQAKADGSPLKDRKDDYSKADLLDCVRYYHWANFNDYLTKHYDYYE